MELGIIVMEDTPVIGVSFDYQGGRFDFSEGRWIELETRGGQLTVRGKFMLDDFRQLANDVKSIKALLPFIRFKLPLTLTIQEGLLLEEQHDFAYLDLIKSFSGDCSFSNQNITFSAGGATHTYPIDAVRRCISSLGLSTAPLGNEDKARLILNLHENYLLRDNIND